MSNEYFDNFLDSIIEIMSEEHDINLDFDNNCLEDLICNCFNNNLSVNETIGILINKLK